MTGWAPLWSMAASLAQGQRWLEVSLPAAGEDGEMPASTVPAVPGAATLLGAPWASGAPPAFWRTTMDGPTLVLFGSPYPDQRAGGMPKGPAVSLLRFCLSESPGGLAKSLHVRHVVGKRVFQGVAASPAHVRRKRRGWSLLEKPLEWRAGGPFQLPLFLSLKSLQIRYTNI